MKPNLVSWSMICIRCAVMQPMRGVWPTALLLTSTPKNYSQQIPATVRDNA